MNRYKVTGRFCVLGESEKIINESIFINKIIEKNSSRLAMEVVIDIMTKKFSLKYQEKIKLKQLSNVVVKKL